MRNCVLPRTQTPKRIEVKASLNHHVIIAHMICLGVFSLSAQMLFRVVEGAYRACVPPASAI